MHAVRRCAIAVGVLLAVQAGALGGFRFADGEGSGLLPVSSARVTVAVEGRLAVTRIEQVVSNPLDRQVEGMCLLRLAADAAVTSLAIWDEAGALAGFPLRRDFALDQYSWTEPARRLPEGAADLRPGSLRLRFAPIPARGSRRLAVEIVQPLQRRGEALAYTVPVVPAEPEGAALGLLVVEAGIRAPHSFTVSTDPLHAALTRIVQPRPDSAAVSFGDEQTDATRPFSLVIRPEAMSSAAATSASIPPRGEGAPGYFAVWLPPLSAPDPGEGGARAVTFLVDASSSMAGERLAAVAAALGQVLPSLPGGDLFNVIAFANQAESFAPAPVAAAPQAVAEALAFLQQRPAQGAVDLGAALHEALQQALPAGVQHRVVLVTDSPPALGVTDAGELDRLVGEWAAPGTRIFTIGLGGQVERGLLAGLARAHGGTVSMVDPGADLALALAAAFTAAVEPELLDIDVVAEGMGVSEVLRPDNPLRAGEEVVLLGRHTEGGRGAFRLTVRAGNWQQTQVHAVELARAEPDTAVQAGDSSGVFLHADFDDGRAQGWSQLPGTEGFWRVDAAHGFYQVVELDGESVAYYQSAVPGNQYAVEARLITPGGMYEVPWPLSPGRWLDVRVEVADGIVTT
ncbi:MAG: VWA domain-containing protein [Candidatus Latescibacterota bacterium]